MSSEQKPMSPVAEELSKLYDESLKLLQDGQIVKGRIIGVTATDVLIDVGYKSEGTVALEEFDDRSGLTVGAEVEVLLEAVENDDGMVVLSKRKAERVK